MREYLGARNARFAVFPGSVLKGRNPDFLMSAELVETSRLWARQNAAIKAEWAERLGAHLVKRTYSEPHWSRKRAAVMARERVTLYGVPLVADRLVQYGRIDAPLARELFIRHALVQREWDSRHRSHRPPARSPAASSTASPSPTGVPSPTRSDCPAGTSTSSTSWAAAPATSSCAN